MYEGHLPHKITIIGQKMESSGQYDVYGPVDSVTVQHIPALLIPGISSVKQVETGPLKRKLYVLMVQPDISIKQGDKVYWEDTQETFYVDNEPILFYNPEYFPQLVKHHIECILLQDVT